MLGHFGVMLIQCQRQFSTAQENSMKNSVSGYRYPWSLADPPGDIRPLHIRSWTFHVYRNSFSASLE
jgi:hypothetical protein